ncbi:MAG: 3-oxoacyl-ACP reductase FabG [Rubrobacter sp.]|nr:3-oxoacyl-ACP reductase FabG [Rubrobacter sp.]MDQ3316525.1 3-oxoacyl-ACP reductase FabG [Actinomycetota bacterium]
MPAIDGVPQGPASPNLSGRVALVTGGSRGIGRATCLALAASGADVAVHYNSNHGLAEEVVAMIEEAGGKSVAVAANLLEKDAGNRVVAAAKSSLGAVDILVNNAGELTTSAVEDLADAVWERTLTLNLTAAFRCARAAIPSMKERRWGRIVNVSSQAAYTGSANHAHYAAAKSGMAGLTFSLAKELGPHGVTANLVVPGRIKTDILADDLPTRQEEWLGQTPARRLGRPEEVAAAIAFLASESASYVMGAALNVGGGLVMG